MKIVRIKKSVTLSVLAALAVVAGVQRSEANVLVSFDAASAGAGVTPTGVDPAWTFSGGGNHQMVNNGSYLLQGNPTPGSYGEYVSPSAGAGVMVYQTTNYGIEFTIQPMTDVRFVGGDWPNLYLSWSDTQWNYNVTIDKYSGDNTSGLGDVVYGRGSFSPAITGIDWSISHTVFIGARGTVGDYGVFDFYLDGVLQSTISGGSIARDRTGWEFLENRVAFGDGTSGGVDVEARWYNVSITDSAAPVPEAENLALLGVIFALAFGYRRIVIRERSSTIA